MPVDVVTLIFHTNMGVKPRLFLDTSIVTSLPGIE